MCVGFSRDGRWIWCGTDGGVRVFDWRVLKQTSDTRPAFASDVARDAHQPRFEFTHAIVEEVDANAIIFGTTAGAIHRMDLESGHTYSLGSIPGDPAIFGLTMSADGRTLGVASHTIPTNLRNSPKDHRWTFDIFDYRRLRGPFMRN